MFFDKNKLTMKKICMLLIVMLSTLTLFAQDQEIQLETSAIEGEEITLKVSGYNAESTLEFSAPKASIIKEDLLAGEITLSYSIVGEYQFGVTEKLGECTYTTIMRIIITPKPEPKPDPQDEPTEKPKPQDEPTENPEPQDEPTEKPDPQEVPTELPEYEDKCALVVPNVFTPNGDGVNDNFHIKYENRPESFSISVFTRSGVKVFSSYNPDFYWDGNGNCAGVYFYMIKYLYGDTLKNLSGSIVMVKK